MTRFAGGLIAVLLVCSLAASPAVADSQTHRDPRGDVNALSGREARPTGPLDDVVRVENTYDGDRLRVSMTARELPRRGWVAFWTIKTQPRGEFSTLAFYATTRRPRAVLLVEPGRVGGGGAVPPTDCRAAKGIVRGETVHASVPRRCLGLPRVVRIGGVIQDERRSRYDDSRQRGYDSSVGPNVLGPPLRHDWIDRPRA